MSIKLPNLPDTWIKRRTACLSISMVLTLLTAVSTSATPSALAECPCMQQNRLLSAHCSQRPVAAQMQIIQGPLEPTVEAGGWLVRDQASGRLFLLLPDDPGLLRQDWVRAGVVVRATGMEVDAVTIYMQGQPFRATSLEPV